MNIQEVMTRIGRLDIRDAEPDDYVALIITMEILAMYAEQKKKESVVEQ